MRTTKSPRFIHPLAVGLSLLVCLGIAIYLLIPAFAGPFGDAQLALDSRQIESDNPHAKPAEHHEREIIDPGRTILAVDFVTGDPVVAEYRLLTRSAEQPSQIQHETRTYSTGDGVQALTDDWTDLAIRAKGYMGRFLQRNDLDVRSTGYLVRLQHAATLSVSVKQLGQPAEGIPVALLPPLLTGNWGPDWRSQRIWKRLRKVLPYGQQTLDLGGYKSEGSFFEWHNSLMQWSATTNKEGMAVFDDVLPSVGYRLAFETRLYIDQSRPRLSANDIGVVTEEGHIAIGKLGRRNYTIQFAITSGQTKQCWVQLASGVIKGRIPTLQDPIRLNLMNQIIQRRQNGQRSHSGFFAHLDGRYEKGAFEYRHVPLGYKRLVVAWKQSDAIRIILKEFNFSGGILDLGLLHPEKGINVTLVPTCKEGSLPASCRSVPIRLLAYSGGAQNTGTIHMSFTWDLHRPIILQGISAKRLKIEPVEMPLESGASLFIGKIPPFDIKPGMAPVPLPFKVRGAARRTVRFTFDRASLAKTVIHYRLLSPDGETAEGKSLWKVGRFAAEASLRLPSRKGTIVAHCYPNSLTSNDAVPVGIPVGVAVWLSGDGPLDVYMQAGTNWAGVIVDRRNRVLANEPVAAGIFHPYSKEPIVLFMRRSDKAGSIAFGGIPPGRSYWIGSAANRYVRSHSRGKAVVER